MIPSPYKDEVLRGCFRVGDSGRWKINLDQQLEAVVQSAVSKVNSNPIQISIVKQTDKSGLIYYSSGDLETSIILRATYKRLIKQYKINLANRDAIITGIIEALSEASPQKITRCDIKSFYESIDAAPIVNAISSDTRTSPQMRSVISQIYTAGEISQETAPRGLAISTVISEIVLREFDSAIRNIPGVHRYFRYADDIIVFSLPNCEVINNIKTQLNKINLSLNEKSNEYLVQSVPANPAQNIPFVRFDFLGYCFSANQTVKTYQSREILVSISKKKIEKRTTRINLSLKAFMKDGNGTLLADRLEYLCSNHSVYRTKHLRGHRKERIRTGIYYNYAHCAHYAGHDKGRIRLPHDYKELIALDRILHALLFSKKSKFANSVSVLPLHQISRLKRLSFSNGYKLRLMKRFSRKQVADICRIWENA